MTARKGDEKLKEVAHAIRILDPPAKLRLAADLLERKRPDLAHTIAQGVCSELGAFLALQMKERT